MFYSSLFRVIIEKKKGRNAFALRPKACLFLGDGAELTSGKAGTALDALHGIDGQSRLLLAGSDVIGLGNGICGAGSCAHTAANALVLGDHIAHQVLADLCRAFLVHHMGNVLIPEVGHGGNNGIGSGLTQGTQRTGLDQIADLLQLVQILQGTLALGDLGEDLQHTAGADTAGGALTAGFVADKFHIELSHIHYAVVFIHNDGTAGAHHGALCHQVIKINGFVQIFSSQRATGRTTSLNGLDVLAVGDAAGADAAKMGIAQGDDVRVTSRRGGVIAEARVTDIVPEGVLFMPFHFADGPANMLTNTVTDPIAKIPELKVCAARIEKA